VNLTEYLDQLDLQIHSIYKDQNSETSYKFLKSLPHLFKKIFVTSKEILKCYKQSYPVEPKKTKELVRLVELLSP